jgi:hypothetical protein
MRAVGVGVGPKSKIYFASHIGQTEDSMILMHSHSAILSLIAGILILLMPRLLNYIVAIYLIITGLLGLLR